MLKKKDIKIKKIESASAKKIGRIVLWIILGFFFLRGIATSIRGNPLKSIKAEINKNSNELVNQVNDSKNAAAYAECFAKEYMTYSSNNSDEYLQRVSKYIPGTLGTINDTSGEGSAEALDAVAIGTNIVGNQGNELNVDIKVKEKYYNFDNAKQSNINSDNSNLDSTNSDNAKYVVKDVYLRVPVKVKNGSYIVDDLPIFIPAPSKADVQHQDYNGKSVDDDTTDDIKAMVQNFLKTYCGGSDGEISYYMLNPSSTIKTLDTSFKFKSIDKVNSYSKEKNKFYTVVDYTVIDEKSNQEIKQRIHINLVKKDRYYIEDFDVRSQN